MLISAFIQYSFTTYQAVFELTSSSSFYVVFTLFCQPHAMMCTPQMPFDSLQSLAFTPHWMSCHQVAISCFFIAVMSSISAMLSVDCHFSCCVVQTMWQMQRWWQLKKRQSLSVSFKVGSGSLKIQKEQDRV